MSKKTTTQNFQQLATRNQIADTRSALICARLQGGAIKNDLKFTVGLTAESVHSWKIHSVLMT